MKRSRVRDIIQKMPCGIKCFSVVQFEHLLIYWRLYRITLQSIQIERICSSDSPIIIYGPSHRLLNFLWLSAFSFLRSHNNTISPIYRDLFQDDLSKFSFVLACPWHKLSKVFLRTSSSSIIWSILLFTASLSSVNCCRSW